MNAHFQQIAKKSGGWEQLWQEGSTPWNMNEPSPPLVTLFEKHSSSVADLAGTNKKALVPGCGEGRDVIYLTTKGYETTGAEISPTALEACRKNAKAANCNAKFILADFFTESLGEPFDFVFDYTFLCAIQPEQRNDWSRRMGEIIRSGGLLVTLMFPLDPSRTTGPPFGLSVELYHQLLDANFDVIFEDTDPPSVPGRQGQERLVVWRRR
ncbi:S-adenosyl-L-methionine-dependent methyltransferase [Syncephalis plumigaleata]|nr:S-adenosyl-L-methionine-dependent methyltransferase [Syncephalis plumigaleata]